MGCDERWGGGRARKDVDQPQSVVDFKGFFFHFSHKYIVWFYTIWKMCSEYVPRSAEIHMNM